MIEKVKQKLKNMKKPEKIDSDDDEVLAPTFRATKPILKERSAFKITKVHKHTIAGKAIVYEAEYDNGTRKSIYSGKIEKQDKDKIIGFYNFSTK